MSNSDREPDQDEFALTEDLVQSPIHKPAGTLTLDFDGLLNPPLQLNEDVSGGNGGQAWPAGMILAQYLLRAKRGEMKNASMLVLTVRLMMDSGMKPVTEPGNLE